MEEQLQCMEFTVTEDMEEERIDKLLSSLMDSFSRSYIQKLLTGGNLLINDKTIGKASYKVKAEDEVKLFVPPAEQLNIEPEDIPLDVLYEDEDLIVVNKPKGMVVHPAFGHFSGTLVNALVWHLKDNPLFTTNDIRPGLVHRIDKDTSGLLVIAKTEQAKAHLALQFFNKTSDRKYVALCWGNLKEDTATITGHIGRHPVNRKIMSVYPDGSHGKQAVTHYKVIERLGDGKNGSKEMYFRNRPDTSNPRPFQIHRTSAF